MTIQDKELLQQCKDEHAIKEGFSSWDELQNANANRIIRIIAISELKTDEVAELYSYKQRENDLKRIDELERGNECFNRSEGNLRDYIASLNKTLIDIYNEARSPEDDSPSIEYIIEKCKKALNL